MFNLPIRIEYHPLLNPLTKAQDWDELVANYVQAVQQRQEGRQTWVEQNGQDSPLNTYGICSKGEFDIIRNWILEQLDEQKSQGNERADLAYKIRSSP